jgi:O-antigen/teichoic acid export membrane protein
VPRLIGALGPGRFGVLTLAWAIIGYFGLFDFGIGRALTQTASEAIGRNDLRRLAEIGPMSIGLMFTLGVVGGLVLCGLTPWLVYDVLKMDAALRPEAARSFYLMAASLPFVLSTAGLRGLFEAHQHFGVATALRLPYALFTFVGPLLVLSFSTSLVVIVGVLVLGRFATWLAHMVVGLERYPWLRSSPIRDPGPIIPLLRIGGWMTVSNIVSPMMVSLDRFLVGALLSMTAVTYYATPYEIVTKLLLVPGALLGVFFPAFALSYVRDRHQTVSVLDRAARAVIVFVFPAALLFVAFAREGLTIWVGPEMARESTRVVQLLAAGVFLNCLGQVVFSMLQAMGRPDLTARLHVVELPLYAVMIYVFATRLGLPGVALAWTMRIAIDTLVLCWLTTKRFMESRAVVNRAGAWTVGLTIVLVTVALPSTLTARAALAAIALVSFTIWSWRVALGASERLLILTAAGLVDRSETPT